MLSRPEDPRCVKHAWEDRTLGEVAEDLARIQAGQDGRFVVSLTLADRDSVVDALNAQDMGSGSEPDPIFATIERHRAALAAYDDLTGQMERACDRNPEGWIADLAIPNLRDELADRLERHKNALTEQIGRAHV